MPRHSKSRKIDAVIDFVYGMRLWPLMFWLWLDMHYCKVVRYFSDNSVGTITTDFLSFLLVAFLILYSPVCLGIWFYLGG